jgi:hypothetical protein
MSPLLDNNNNNNNRTATIISIREVLLLPTKL